ncbi:ethanolamine ammonia-lyase subunit EutC [Nocardia sp. NPDC052566]|uniref:ethanolamine ammonia-lyase subunit EutC n=1 Tax=Nocardia sp. NPDC052566 TaxID=3364330 RepID=UPI0037CCC121
MAAGDGAVRGFWEELRGSTQARIGLGRTGDALPTTQVLEFRAAHAAARDAVHLPLDVESLRERVVALGLGEPVHVMSRARDRAEYLRRPDLGRLPASSGLAAVPHSGAEIGDGSGLGAVTRSGAGIGDGSGLGAVTRSGAGIGDGSGLVAVPHGGAEIGIVLADGLSPLALSAHGPAMVAALIEELGPLYSIAAPVIATQARVALGDHIAEAMGVATVLVLIGERPGLSVADSLGIYLTHLPRPGRTDADRNCISNIHPPEGLGYAQAAKVVAGLVSGARVLGRSGVDLKDTSRTDAVAGGEVVSIGAPRS